MRSDGAEKGKKEEKDNKKKYGYLNKKELKVEKNKEKNCESL